MTTRNTLRSARSALAALVLAGAAQGAEITGNFKRFESGTKQPAPGTFESYSEVNAWYTLPGNVNGYSFLDVYTNTSDSYFGKTTLSKKIVGNLSGAAQFKYVGEPLTEAGLGARLNLPVKNGYAGVGLLPVWLDKRGNQQAKTIVGFAFGKDLGQGFNLEAFAEAKYAGKHFSWGYGEVELTKKVGPFKLGVSGALQPKGKSMPTIEPRTVIRYDWKVRGKGTK